MSRRIARTKEQAVFKRKLFFTAILKEVIMSRQRHLRLSRKWLLWISACLILSMSLPAQASPHTFGTSNASLTLDSEEGRTLVNGEQGPLVYVIYWKDEVQFLPQVDLPQEEPVKWVYLYYGDGSGEFISPGTTYIHSYTLSYSRYNPSLLIKTEHTLTIVTVELYLSWNTGELPDDHDLAPIVPTSTFNSELDEVLQLLILDNSELA